MISYYTIYTIIMLLGVGGFLISFYIYYHKKHQKPLICPLRLKCSAVVNSSYSSVAGVPIEIFGMLYYGFIAIAYAGLLVFPELTNGLVLAISMLISFCAVCFSLYLIFVQGFVIREWCSWCILSALFSLGIFFLSIFFVPESVIAFLVEHKKIITVLHLFGVILGVGGATFSDLFFFKFLKDSKFSFAETDLLKIFSRVVWIGIALLVITGLGLYLPQSAILNHSPKFMVKMIAVAVLIVNGIILNFAITPKLLAIDFSLPSAYKRFAFLAGAISISSWYFIFTLGALRKINITFPTLFAVYISILLVAMAGSQILASFGPGKK